MIYFIPNAKTLNSKLLESAGIADFLPNPIARETTAGPTGTAGILVTQQYESTPALQFQPDQQTWLKRDRDGRCWLGVHHGHSVTASMLARESQFEGDRVRLADGSGWVVPRIREFRERDTESPFSVQYRLPRSLTYDPETGTFTTGNVISQYRAIADEAIVIGDAVHSQLVGKGSAELPQARIDRFAGAVLRLNYRVDVPELGLLELLDESTLIKVVRAALHLDWFEAALKKRVASRHFATSTLTDGD